LIQVVTDGDEELARRVKDFVREDRLLIVTVFEIESS
jgi:hypothetical protein